MGSLVRPGIWHRLAESLLVSIGVLFVGAICWSTIIYWHKLPFKQGDYGRYGIVEDAAVFTPGTKIMNFQATYVPSRILRIARFVLWPVPEVVEVSVTYQQPGQQPRAWEHTYLVTCDLQGKECLALYQLVGIQIHGVGIVADGGTEYGWVYLRGQIIPHIGSNPAPPHPAATPSPSPNPKKKFQYGIPNGSLRVFLIPAPVHKAGVFFIPMMVK